MSSDKISLNGVSIELGFGGMPNLTALNEILYKSVRNGLNIYFDVAVYGADIHGSFEDILDDQGEVVRVMVEGDSTYINRGCKRLITLDSIHDFNITVSQFSYENKLYYPVEETGMWLEFITLDLNQFYCYRAELDALINKKEKKISIQKSRENTLKKMLANKANMEINNDLDYQTAYQYINEPTQADLWDMLKNFAPEQFRAGQSDFFKYFRSINFKLGTGSGR